MKITKTTIDKIKELRKDYLKSLPEFQELFIEIMINDSDFFILRKKDKEIGYAVRSNDSVLIEFYVVDKYIPDCNAFFNKVLNELSIKNIYCKSFDSLLLSNCLLNSLPYSLLGFLYRDYVGALVKIDSGVKMKKADFSSVGLLLGQDESIKELFETEQQLIEYIQNENVFEFYKSDEFVGCGIVIRTHSDWNYCDLGIWVNPLKRGKGFGAQIILYLREFAIKNNMNPSCGCSIENLASRKAIEKSGFVSKHKMINFKTK